MKNLAALAATVLAGTVPLCALEPDPTFGYRGLVSTFVDNKSVSALAVQNDGKILACGVWGALVRYERNGVLDRFFGEEGIVIASFPVYASFSLMVLQPDGRIVVAGWASGGGTSGFFVARYLTDGSLDPSFGSGGYITTDFPGGAAGIGAIALQTDGKIVAAGAVASSQYPLPPSSDFAVARYNPDGQLDSTFGSGGRVVIDTAVYPDGARGVAVEADGRVIVGGSSDTGGWVLVGLLADGSLDPSFGLGGKVFPSTGFASEFHALVGQSDGKIVVSGTRWDTGELFAARFGANGSPDLSFGEGGVATLAGVFNNSALGLDGRGRIVLTGEELIHDLVLVRLLPDGRPDLTVGSQGWRQIDFGGHEPQGGSGVEALAIGAGNSIIVGGYHSLFATYFALARYLDVKTETIPLLSRESTILFVILLGLTGLFVLKRSLEERASRRCRPAACSSAGPFGDHARLQLGRPRDRDDVWTSWQGLGPSSLSACSPWCVIWAMSPRFPV